MMHVICQHCQIVTQVRLREQRPLLLADELVALHCRACERAGGMRPAFYDRGLGEWRARIDGDVDLAELRIEGRLLTMVELYALDLVVAFCEAHRGEWQGIDSVFPTMGRPAGQPRLITGRLIEAGVLQAAGLEVQPERPGFFRLFRAAPLKAFATDH